MLTLKRVEDTAASGMIRSALRDDSAEGVRIAAASLLANERWSDATPELAYAAVGRMGANMARRLKDCGSILQPFATPPRLTPK